MGQNDVAVDVVVDVAVDVAVDVVESDAEAPPQTRHVSGHRDLAEAEGSPVMDAADDFVEEKTQQSPPSSLRAAAWSQVKPLPATSFTTQQRLNEAEKSGTLLDLLADPNIDLALRAALRIAAKSEQSVGIDVLERVTRLKGGDSDLRRLAFASLGDLLAAKGDMVAAEAAWGKALTQ